jgi:DNA adenine methylase
MGGFSQKSKYKIGCLYNIENIINKIKDIRILLRGRTIVTNIDFRNLMLGDVSYFDPPYVVVGNKLYAMPFGEKDHIDLKNIIENTKSKWLISYNDHELVRSLYSNYKIDIYDHTMAMTSFC